MMLGERVRKKTGYRFEGILLSAFTIPPGYPKAGVAMGNVIHDDGWVMHFRLDDLELARKGVEDERSGPDPRGADAAGRTQGV